MQPIHVSIPNNSPPGTTTTWVRFDSWNIGEANVQVVVSGTVNYTLQTTFDDPNSIANPISPAFVTWFDSTDADVKNSTKNAVSQIFPVPVFARILLNSGNGTVDATFIQQGTTPA